MKEKMDKTKNIPSHAKGKLPVSKGRENGGRKNLSLVSLSLSIFRRKRNSDQRWRERREREEGKVCN